MVQGPAASALPRELSFRIEGKIKNNKFKRVEIISSVFSDHKSIKLEINHRKENRKKKKDDMETKQHATKKSVGQQ